MSPSVQYVNQGWNGLVSMQQASGIGDGRNVFQDWDLPAWFPSQFTGAVGMNTGHSGEGFPSHLQRQPCPEDEFFWLSHLSPCPETSPGGCWWDA